MRQHKLRRESERLVEDAASVARKYFLAVDEKIGEADDIRFGFLVEVTLIERHHAVDTTQEHLTFPTDIDGFLVDRSQGKAGRAVVVAERVTTLVEDGEAAVRDEQQLIIVKRRRCRGIDAVALQPFGLPESPEAVFGLDILLDGVACCSQPDGALPVNGDVGDIVVGQLSFSFLLREASDRSASQVVAPHTPSLRGYPEAVAEVDTKRGHRIGQAFAPEQRPEHVLSLGIRVHETDTTLGADNELAAIGNDVAEDVGRQRTAVPRSVAVTSHRIVGETDTVQPAKVSTHPERVAQPVEVDGFQIRRRRTAVPADGSGLAVEDVQTAALGTDPQTAVVVFRHRAYDRA